MNCTWTCFTKLRSCFGISKHIFRQQFPTMFRVSRIRNFLVGSYVCMSAIPTVQKLDIPDIDHLSTARLLENSSASSTEAASALLTYVTVALSDAEKENTKAIYTLIKLMEVRLEILGHPEEEKLQDLIVETRSTLNKMKQKRQNLAMLLTTCQRLLNDAAETAFMTGAEYAGIAGNEKITSCEIYLKPYELDRVNAECQLREMEAKVIEVESKHAEEKEKEKQKAEQNETHSENAEDNRNTEKNKNSSENGDKGTEND